MGGEMAHGYDMGTNHGISLMGSKRISLGCVGLCSSGRWIKDELIFLSEHD